MKKPLLLLCSVALITAASAQTVLILENFEAYPAGAAPATVNPLYWALWPGGGDQVVTDSIAHGSTKSMACIATTTGGGPGDLLLKLGDKTSGSYGLSWWMYVPAGKGGYFNIQHIEAVTTGSFAAEVKFRDGGTVWLLTEGDSVSGSYPQDAWFQVNMFFDLAAQEASLLIGLTPIDTWAFNTLSTGATGPNQLGAINFYSFGGAAPTLGEYYVDDISYIQLPSIGIEETSSSNAFNVYPVPSSNTITIANERSNDAAQWRMLDMSGREVMASTARVVAGGKSVVDISALALGAYTMEVLHGNVRERHTVVRN